MAFTFKTIGHFLAVFYLSVVRALPKIEGSASEVEAITNSIPGGAVAVGLEKVAYAVLGEVASLLTIGGEAAVATLTQAGLDVAVVNQVQTLVATFPAIATLAKSLKPTS